MIENAVMNCIRERRSTRKFQETQIDRKELDTILEGAVWAPSGSNNQSWLFTAVQNKEILAELNEVVKEAFQTWIPDDDYPAKQTIKKQIQTEGYNFYYNAPTLIIASNKRSYSNAMADCALAMENMFLAAQSIGVGSCYINHLYWLRNTEPVINYLEKLGIPKDYMVCCSGAFGYSAGSSPVPKRKEGRVRIIL